MLRTERFHKSLAGIRTPPTSRQSTWDRHGPPISVTDEGITRLDEVGKLMKVVTGWRD